MTTLWQHDWGIFLKFLSAWGSVSNSVGNVRTTPYENGFSWRDEVTCKETNRHCTTTTSIFSMLAEHQTHVSAWGSYGHWKVQISTEMCCSFFKYIFCAYSPDNMLFVTVIDSTTIDNSHHPDISPWNTNLIKFKIQDVK